MMNNIVIENTNIFYRNFAGTPDRFHPEGGYRSFNVTIPDVDLAQQMIEEGWNVKVQPPREEGDLPNYHIQVKVKFGMYPPKICMLVAGHKTYLDENTVGVLDQAYIERNGVDICIRPYTHNNGISAYLKTMYVKVQQDALDAKYENYGV